MRKDNDQRHKIQIKKEIFENNFNVNDIYCVFENDYDLIKMWQDLKLKTFEVDL